MSSHHAHDHGDTSLVLAAMRVAGCDPDTLTTNGADRAFAARIGAGERSVREWRTGARELQGPARTLFRLLVARPSLTRLLPR